jgi:photosystem II stability/assembly factor-like uncharacterized protein
MSRSYVMFLLFLGVAAAILPGNAKEESNDAVNEYVIHMAVLSNASYVVGAQNPEAGIFRSYDNGHSWEHTGWKNTRAFAVGIGPMQSGETLLVAAGNGVLKTTDGGSFWRLTTDWRITEVLDIAFNRDDPTVVYIATAYGFYRSTDGGETWKRPDDGLHNVYISTLMVDENDANIVYAGGETGLYISRDGGITWTLSHFKGMEVRSIVQNPAAVDVMFVGTEYDGIYRSTDGGTTWSPSGTGFPDRPIYAIACDQQNPGIVYAGGFQTGLYRSTDGGGSWKRTGGAVSDKTIMTIAVHPADTNILFVGTYMNGIYSSPDAGRTWRQAGLPRADVWDIKIR